MRAYVSGLFSQPVDVVWRLVGDFHAMADWVPTIARADQEGSGVGSVRVLLRQDGGVVRERLVGYDEPDRHLCYEFAGPHGFAVRCFRGTVRLRPVTSTGETFLEWFADFDADAADEAELTVTFEAIFGGLLDALRERLDDTAV